MTVLKGQRIQLFMAFWGLIMVVSVHAGAINDTLLTDSLDAQRSLIQLDEIRVNAPIVIRSRTRWPGAIAELDSRGINSGNSFQLSEQLNGLPGIQMQQGTMSTNRITIRGIGSRTPYESNRIKAYWGDMPLTNGDGVTAIEDLALADIKGVRIVKGPSSALYGAGLGGVVLLDPWSTPNPDQPFWFKGETGAYSTYSNQAGLSLSNASGGWLSLAATQLHTDGYRENSRYDRYTISLKGRQLLGRHQLHFLYNYLHLNGQIPSSLDSIDFRNNPRKAADTWKAIKGNEKAQRHLFSAGAVSQWSPELRNAINVFSQIYFLDELRPFNRQDEQRQAIGFRDRLMADLSSWHLQLGVEVMTEANKVEYYSVDETTYDQWLNGSDIQRSYANVFGMAEYAGDRWVVQASLNYNQTFYRSGDPGSQVRNTHRYDGVFSPRLGLNYHLFGSSYVYAAAGHGFSAPSVEEARFPDASFNPGIQPEKGWNTEMGYRYSSADGRTHVDFTFYRMKMSNLLVTRRESEAVFYGVNAGTTKHWGIEADMNQRFWQAGDRRFLDLSLSYFSSKNKFESFVDDGMDYSGNHLPGIPEYTATLDAHLYAKPFHVTANYKWVGEQYLDDANGHIYTAFHKANMKASVDFEVNTSLCQLYFGVDNLFNEHYASMVLINASSFGNSLPRYYYPGLPFNIFGGVSVRF